MSASVRPSRPPPPPPNEYTWTAPELARAKDLRFEGYTHGTIAGMLREEFGTLRTRHGVQKMFSNLKRRSPSDEPKPRASSGARPSMAKPSEVQAANATRRMCLSCTNPFDSEGPGNRICLNCKASDRWRGQPA